MSELHFGFSAFSLRLTGLPATLADRLRAEWAAFVVDAASGPSLTAAIDHDPGLLYERTIPFSPKAMHGDLRGETAVFTLPEGRAAIDGVGGARITLHGEPDARLYFALINLLRAAIAWSLPSHGILMLHAAGLRVDGRAFLLVGPEACGKSTWVRAGIDGGAQPISDDIVLVDTRPDRALALGSPFRSTQRADYRPGHWEIGALLLPRWGSEPTLERVSPLQAQLALVSNLPFVAEALSRPSIAAAVDRLSAQSWRRLTFAAAASFVSLLEGWTRDGE